MAPHLLHLDNGRVGVTRHVPAALAAATWLLAGVRCVAAAPGQAPPAAQDLTQVINAGANVSVVDTTRNRVVGTVSSVTPAQLKIRVPDGSEITFPASSVGRITVRDSVRNGIVIGFIVGLGAGLAGGLSQNAICSNEGGTCPGALIGLIALGAGAGIGIGAAADGLRQRTVYNTLSRQPDVPSEFTSEIGINFGGGQLARDSGGPFSMPPSIGGTWTYQHISGVGVELEIYRTIGESLRPVDCVTPIFGPPAFAGQCLGSGEEGVGKTLAGSAKFVYTFRATRTRPYVTGGLSQSTMRFHSTYGVIIANEPHLTSQISSVNETLAVVGGGARIMLNRMLTIRPDITVAFNASEWRTRIVVGAGFRW